MAWEQDCQYIFHSNIFFSHLIIVLSGNFKGDSEIFKPSYIPALVIFAVLVSLGIFYIIRKLEPFISGKAASLAVIFMVLLELYPEIAADRSGDYASEGFLAFDSVANTLNPMECRSCYLACIDSKVYLQMVERSRDDVDDSAARLFGAWLVFCARLQVGGPA